MEEIIQYGKYDQGIAQFILRTENWTRSGQAKDWLNLLISRIRNRGNDTAVDDFLLITIFSNPRWRNDPDFEKWIDTFIEFESLEYRWPSVFDDLSLKDHPRFSEWMNKLLAKKNYLVLNAAAAQASPLWPGWIKESMKNPVARDRIYAPFESGACFDRFPKCTTWIQEIITNVPANPSRVEWGVKEEFEEVLRLPHWQKYFGQRLRGREVNFENVRQYYERAKNPKN